MEGDRLSALPEEVLLKILLLLPPETAIVTCLLVKKTWYDEKLWTKLTDLVFNFNDLNHWFLNGQRITDELDKLHSFCVNFARTSGLLSCPKGRQSLKSWIDAVCRRQRQVMLKKIQVTVEGRLQLDPSIFLSSVIFECPSLEVLSLKGPFQFDVQNLNVLYLHVLRVIKLDVYALDSVFMTRLFNSCLSLQELTLDAHSIRGETSLNLSAPNLNKLSVSIRNNPHTGNFEINNCPNLQHLTLYAPSLSLFLIENIGALATANISGDDYQMITGDNLAPYVQGVLTLDLNSATLIKFNLLNGYFENLTKLSIKLDVNSNGPHLRWNDVVDFLRGTPNLEVLILDLYRVGMKWVALAPQYPPPCGLDSLKRVQIIRFRGDPHDVNMIGYILKKAGALELLSLEKVLLGHKKSSGLDDCEEIQLCSDLFYFERKSSTCQIDFSSKFLKASSKGFYNGKPHCDIVRWGETRHYLGVKADFEPKDGKSLLTMKPTALRGDSVKSWNDVLSAIEDSPYLLEALLVDLNHSHLSMKWVEPDPNPLGFGSLKWIKITGFAGTEDAVKMVTYMLRNAQALELLSLDANIYDWSNYHSAYDCDWVFYNTESSIDSLLPDERSLCDELFSLGRSSSSCEVKFSGKLLTASSNGFRGRVPYVRILQLGDLCCKEGLHCVKGAVDEAGPSSEQR